MMNQRIDIHLIGAPCDSLPKVIHKGSIWIKFLHVGLEFVQVARGLLKNTLSKVVQTVFTPMRSPLVIFDLI